MHTFYIYIRIGGFVIQITNPLTVLLHLGSLLFLLLNLNCAFSFTLNLLVRFILIHHSVILATASDSRSMQRTATKLCHGSFVQLKKLSYHFQCWDK